MLNKEDDFESCGIGKIERDIKNGSDLISLEHVDKQSSDYFYVWDIGYDCIRKKYYSIVNPKELSWELRRRLSIGSAIHREIQIMLEKSGYDIEVPIKKEYPHGFTVSAKIDAINYSKNALVELKSNAFFKYLNKPYRANISQIQMYLDMANVDEGYLVYVDINTGMIKEFVIKRDNNVILDNLEKLSVVKYSIENNMLPFKVRSHICKTCEYKEECKNDVVI